MYVSPGRGHGGLPPDHFFQNTACVAIALFGGAREPRGVCVGCWPTMGISIGRCPWFVYGWLTVWTWMLWMSTCCCVVPAVHCFLGLALKGAREGGGVSANEPRGGVLVQRGLALTRRAGGGGGHYVLRLPVCPSHLPTHHGNCHAYTRRCTHKAACGHRRSLVIVGGCGGWPPRRA